jgi:hypothetical protein
MAGHAERGMSAPPEVVFNTATDPDRVDGWLPEPLRAQRKPQADDALGARWENGGWSAELQAEPADPGGARVLFDLGGNLPDDHLANLADESLARLAEYVDDNFTAG